MAFLYKFPTWVWVLRGLDTACKRSIPSWHQHRPGDNWREREKQEKRRGRRSACYYWTILSLARGHTHYITVWSHIIHPVNSLSTVTVAQPKAKCVLHTMHMHMSQNNVHYFWRVETIGISMSQCLCCWQNQCSQKPQALCGRPALPKMWTSALWLLERAEAVVKRAEQCCTAVMETIPSSWGLSVREDEGDGPEENEIWEEGEWYLALPPGLHCRSSEVAGGWRCLWGAPGGDSIKLHTEWMHF